MFLSSISLINREEVTAIMRTINSELIELRTASDLNAYISYNSENCVILYFRESNLVSIQKLNLKSLVKHSDLIMSLYVNKYNLEVQKYKHVTLPYVFIDRVLLQPIKESGFRNIEYYFNSFFGENVYNIIKLSSGSKLEHTLCYAIRQVRYPTYINFYNINRNSETGYDFNYIEYETFVDLVFKGKLFLSHQMLLCGSLLTTNLTGLDIVKITQQDDFENETLFNSVARYLERD